MDIVVVEDDTERSTTLSIVHHASAVVRRSFLRRCTISSCSLFLLAGWIAVFITVWVLVVQSEDDQSQSNLEEACASLHSGLSLGLHHIAKMVSDLSGMNFARNGSLTQTEFGRWINHTKSISNRKDIASRFWGAAFQIAVFTEVLIGQEARAMRDAELLAEKGHPILSLSCDPVIGCSQAGPAPPEQEIFNVMKYETRAAFIPQSIIGIDIVSLVPPEDVVGAIVVPAIRNPGTLIFCGGYSTGHLCMFQNISNAIPLLIEEFEDDVSFTIWDINADICQWNCNSSLTPYGERYPLLHPEVRRTGSWGNRNFLFTQQLAFESRPIAFTCARRSSANLVSRSLPVIWVTLSVSAGVLVAVLIILLTAVTEYRILLTKHLQRVAGDCKIAQREAVAADRAKSAFLACMSHEIRTPLNGMLGSAHLLRDDKCPLTKQQKLEVEQMEVCGDMLVCMVQDILDFCKLEENRLVLCMSATVFRDITSSCHRIISLKADPKGVALSCLIDENVPECFYLDRTRLRQVVLNLLANAVKFTPSGGSVVLHASFEEAMDDVCDDLVRPTVERARHGMLSVTVSDTGVGISEDGLGRVFNAFEQVDVTTTRKFGGSGLGLAIAKSLIELMGGTISATSVVSEGSVFGFDIPVKEAPKELVGAGAIDDELVASSIAPKELVDDELVASSTLASIRAPHCTKGNDDDGVDCVSEVDFKADKEGEDQATAGAGPIESGGLRARPPNTVRRVLIVDDNEINRKVAARMMERQEWECAHAQDGKMGVEMTMREKFDIIFMDCHMPVMDGYEAAMAIRDPANPNCDTPIVALSADAFEDNVERCRECGMVEFLPKPLKAAQLREVVLKVTHQDQ